MTGIETCKTCRYWDELFDDSKDAKGYCRRRSPIPNQPGEGEKILLCYWPVTLDEDWCGEFQK